MFRFSCRPLPFPLFVLSKKRKDMHFFRLSKKKSLALVSKKLKDSLAIFFCLKKKEEIKKKVNKKTFRYNKLFFAKCQLAVQR
jgi:hypothetical protein